MGLWSLSLDMMRARPPSIQVQECWVLLGSHRETVVTRAAFGCSLGWALLLPWRSCGPVQGPTY